MKVDVTVRERGEGEREIEGLRERKGERQRGRERGEREREGEESLKHKTQQEGEKVFIPKVSGTRSD